MWASLERMIRPRLSFLLALACWLFLLTPVTRSSEGPTFEKYAVAADNVEASEAGAAVLAASHDLEEIRDLADRVVVLFSGRVVADLPAAEATTARVGAAMAGLDTPDEETTT